eukprot:TRINITY_DN7092_c0_g1_i1.p1 TRINITY_DN7092_c0_g1~~TRINITY_DN7092_c0_g1_i1.p1  ORF type:complete len:163 (-),score=40.36 TRINITY_DN7092_c0_g1_i1:205-693(-)
MAKNATFGGGCFWGVEKFFRKEFPKLKSTRVGYMGGAVQTPSYEQVCSGKTGHAEVLQVSYDPEEVKYRDLLTLFFRIHNPTTLNRQGNDVGTQYRSVIFTHDEEQYKEAQAMKSEIDNSKKFSSPIVTEITAAGEFWDAEEYHQRYLDHHPNGYCNHRFYW